MVDPGASLALRPTQSGGNFSTHFDKVLGLDKELKKDYYTIDMPMLQKFSLGRVVAPCPVGLVYHDLKKEVEETPRFLDRVVELAKTEAWGQLLREHRLAQQHGARGIVPLGLYLDGVPFLKRDSAIGFWFINLATTKRHLALVVRKRQTCRCSCQGWCTLFAAFEYVRWLVATMVGGAFPTQKHDGAPWAAGDPNAVLGGRPLGFRACVLMVKGDWSEFSNTLAYPSWASHKHPCFACACTGGPDGDWQKIEGVSVVALPWAAKGSAAYSAACAAAEVRVTVPSAEVWQALLGHLRFDHRKAGSHGRALLVDFPTLGLEKGDRLEPSPSHPDVLVENHNPTFPLELVFWRPSAEGLCKHRNPLFHPSTMIEPEAMCIDEMHTMHLGVFQVYILSVLWGLVVADAWGAGGNLPEDAAHERSALRLRHDLFQWYASQKRRFPTKPLYELADFSLKMMGSKHKPSLNAKAAESGTLLEFAVAMCKTHQASLPNGAALLGAGEALVQYLQVTRGAPPKLRPGQRQAVMDAMLRFLALREEAGIPWKPKMHLMLHLAHQTGKFGNPLAGATWHDEGLNRHLAAVCRSSHAAVFHKRVLATFRHELGPATTQAKKRKV